MRLEILIHTEKSDRLLKEHPPKDGNTNYACGLYLSGCWASRLEQHEKFCKTTIGLYILNLEKTQTQL